MVLLQPRPRAALYCSVRVSLIFMREGAPVLESDWSHKSSSVVTACHLPLVCRNVVVTRRRSSFVVVILSSSSYRYRALGVEHRRCVLCVCYVISNTSRLWLRQRKEQPVIDSQTAVLFLSHLAARHRTALLVCVCVTHRGCTFLERPASIEGATYTNTGHCCCSNLWISGIAVCGAQTN